MLEIADAYEALVRIRALEIAQASLWEEGLVSGELHTATGEEAVAVGVVRHLVAGDAMALDHRGSGPLVARGADLRSLLLEATGSEAGLCRGAGGHMHLFAPDLLALSDGIVGSSGPTACGLALGAQRLRRGTVAVAFFGEGAANAGMLMESWNLAVAWRLPVLFVCKDSRWSITTRSSRVTGGDLADRARAFGMPTRSVPGWKVEAVSAAAQRLIERARAGRGPGFLLATVLRPDGHFMGDPMIRLLRRPFDEGRTLAPGLMAALTAQPGAPARARATAMADLAGRFATLATERIALRRDPVQHARRRLEPSTAAAIESRVAAEVTEAMDDVRRSVSFTRASGAVR